MSGPRWGIIQDQIDEVGTWVCDRTGTLWYDGRGTAVGFTFDGRLVGGCTYEQFNGANVYLRFSLTDARFINRATAWATFSYPFDQLGCKRVTALVDSDNLRSLAFVKRLGFAYEATLQDAAPNGDQIVFRMLKSECRWIRNQRFQPRRLAA